MCNTDPCKSYCSPVVLVGPPFEVLFEIRRLLPNDTMEPAPTARAPYALKELVVLDIVIIAPVPLAIMPLFVLFDATQFSKLSCAAVAVESSPKPLLVLAEATLLLTKADDLSSARMPAVQWSKRLSETVANALTEAPGLMSRHDIAAS